MTLKEIEERKSELLNEIAEAKTEEELTELRNEVEAINKEVPEQEEKKDGEISHEEERSLIADTQELEKKSKDLSELRKIGGNEEMEKEERKLTKTNVLKSAEYRSAWAKKLMCCNDNEFTEEEKRALDVALTTTATTFKAPSGDADGVNNGGLFIPETVSLEILKQLELQSPFLADVAKTYVKGLMSFPYKKSSSGVDHPEEGKDTKLESDEYASLTFGNVELAKTVRITWKLEAMAVDDFISFIISVSFFY